MNKNLSARKKPTQERSQKMVNRILDAARTLLRDSKESKQAKITTNCLAREAGISVGSLYQYFPNTEAVLYEVYNSILIPIRNVLDKFNSAEYLSLPRDEFFDRFIHEIINAEADDELLYGLQDAMKKYPNLAEADRLHAEQAAEKTAKLLKHYGSDWPLEKLERLGLYVYYLDAGSSMYRKHQNSAREESHEWQIGIFKFMISQCFSD